MFGFGTFHFFNIKFVLFPLDFLTEWRNSCLFFAGIANIEFGKGDQGCAWRTSQLKILKITWQFITKDKIDDFSSKQSFEEESWYNIITMKFLKWKLILNLPHVPASIIGHFED